MRLIDADAYKKELLIGEGFLDEDTLLTTINILDCAPTIEAEPVRHGCPYCCDNGRVSHSYDDYDGMEMSIHPSKKRKDGSQSLAWWATVHFRGESRDFYIESCPFCGRRLVPLKEEYDSVDPNCGTKMDLEE